MNLLDAPIELQTIGLLIIVGLIWDFAGPSIKRLIELYKDLDH